MGKRHLIDTSIIVYYLDGLLTAAARKFVKSAIQNGSHLSVVSKIELRVWRSPDGSRKEAIDTILNHEIIYRLDDDVVDATVSIRQKYKKLKLPDAIIAATAAVHNLSLILRNLSDFAFIKEITVIDPLSCNAIH